MAKKKTQTQPQAPALVITLTLPEEEGEQRNGTLLIARGELAHVREFSYTNLGEITAILKDAVVALGALEADPPVLAEVKDMTGAGKKAATADPPSSADEEPTVDVPTKKGVVAVKVSHLKLVGRETDAAAYREAVLAAGRFIDGKLWDGKTPIRFEDIDGVQRKLKHLTDKELMLFTLDDFVQAGDGPSQPEAESEPDAVSETASVQVEDGPEEPDPATVPLWVNDSMRATDESGE